MGPEHIPLILYLFKVVFVFGLGVVLIVMVMYLEDWRKTRRGKKMSRKQKLAMVSWECPRCECRGGLSGENLNHIVGLCVPTLEDPEKAHCFGCGWVGDIDDATITAVEVPRDLV